MLTSAALEFDGAVILRVSFDRDVNADALDAAEITVQDPGGTGFAYAGAQLISQPSANELLIELAETGSAVGTLDVMTATADTGIVAVDDGATWAGVTGLGLPFP